MTSTSASKGFLFVYAEVGDRVPESDFHDWYEEHIALRTALPGFLSATRLVQNDGQKPAWCAIYDLTSADYLEDEAYTNLAKTANQRERDILANIGYLERRVYKLIEAPETSTVSPEYKEKGLKEGGAFIFLSMDVEPSFEEELARWYSEEHIDLLAKVPGWLRSSRYVLVDSSVRGTSQEMTAKFKQPPKLLAIHEYEKPGPDQVNGPEFRAAISTPWRQRVFENNKNVERRLFKVYKTY